MCKVQGGTFGHTKHPLCSLQNWFARGCGESLLRFRDLKQLVQKQPTCADHISRSLAQLAQGSGRALWAHKGSHLFAPKLVSLRLRRRFAVLVQLKHFVQKQPTCANHNSRSLALLVQGSGRAFWANKASHLLTPTLVCLWLRQKCAALGGLEKMGSKAANLCRPHL